jgi:hypothetical protein
LAHPLPSRTAVFANGKYDDQLESTAQMLEWFKGAAPEPGFLGCSRMLAQTRAS